MLHPPSPLRPALPDGRDRKMPKCRTKPVKHTRNVVPPRGSEKKSPGASKLGGQIRHLAALVKMSSRQYVRSKSVARNVVSSRIHYFSECSVECALESPCMKGTREVRKSLTSRKARLRGFVRYLYTITHDRLEAKVRREKCVKKCIACYTF